MAVCCVLVRPAEFNHESFSIIRFAPIAFQFAIILAQKLNFPPISFLGRSVGGARN